MSFKLKIWIILCEIHSNNQQMKSTSFTDEGLTKQPSVFVGAGLCRWVRIVPLRAQLGRRSLWRRLCLRGWWSDWLWLVGELIWLVVMRSVSQGLAHVGQVSESIVSTPTHYNETGTKGLTAQPRVCVGGVDQTKEWSLTPDLPDIIQKMQINPYFQKWSRTTRDQTRFTL